MHCSSPIGPGGIGGGGTGSVTNDENSDKIGITPKTEASWRKIINFNLWSTKLVNLSRHTRCCRSVCYIANYKYSNFNYQIL